MQRIVRFSRAVGTHWGALVTGGVIVGFVGTYQGTGHSVAPWVYGAIGIASVVIAFYRAWCDQFERAEKLEAEAAARASLPLQLPRLDVHVSPVSSSGDGPPRIHMRAVQPNLDSMRGMSFDGAPFPEVEFRLRHLSGRPATSLSVSGIGSLNGNFSIRFDVLSFLPINGEELIGFEVVKTGGFTSRKAIALGGRAHLLPDFVWDSRNGQEEAHFPFIVWFMDDGQQMSLRLRLVYNFNARKFDIMDDIPY